MPLVFLPLAKPGTARRAGGAARGPAARRGMVTVLAMLFLMLFSVMALAFYFSAAMSVQISSNEKNVYASQVAAESGLAFFRYHLSKVNVPAAIAPDKVLDEVYMQLDCNLQGTGNLGTRPIGFDGRAITIPGGTNEYIATGTSGGGFRAVITLAPGGNKLVVKTVGATGTASAPVYRGVQVEFNRTNLPSTIFDYGVASAGRVQLKSGAATKVLGTPDADGSILSTFNGAGAIRTGSGPIDGDLFVVGSKNNVILGGGTVGGESDPMLIKALHIHTVTPPLFPYVDTTYFKPLATNLYVAGAPVQKNVRVPPNTNPRFNAGDVINGILYIESPNDVEFRGHATINGVIVFENKGGPAVNTLDFKGNVKPSSIPNTPEYDAIRAAAKGWAIAAPAASVTMSGSVDGDLEGSIVANVVDVNGSADLFLKGGSIISVGNSPTLLEGKTVNFTGTAADNVPNFGYRLDANYLPDPKTYQEVRP